MEKILTIDGRRVPFKTNGIALLLYKQQTGRELIPDLFRLLGGVKPDDIAKNDLGLVNLDTQVLYDVCWTFAKLADPSIPPVMEWAGGFERFPLVDVFKEILELVLDCISCSADVKKAQATAGWSRSAKRSKPTGLFLRPRR